MNDKFILDACCGIKSMWIQKNHPNVIYIDIRKEPKKHFKGNLFGMKKVKGFLPIRQNREVNPDLIADFRNLPFKDKQFKLIAWDPPHLIGKPNKTDMITASYGVLNAETWQDDFKKGFKEIWRCLDDYGVLVFKFNDHTIPFKKVLNLFPEKALFGTTSNNRKNSITRWFCFMKIPKGAENTEKKKTFKY